MKITKIEKQKKNSSRYSIYIDDEYSFGAYDDTLLKYGLRTGDELSALLIEEIKNFDEFNYGKKVAYAYLSYKQRSRKEVEKKLRSKKLSEASIVKIVEWLEELKYLNDEYYSKLFIENKTARKPLGKVMLKRKLGEAGIDKELIEKSLMENYPEEKELEKARELLGKYLKKVRYKNETDKKSKCFKYLLSRGFTYGVVEQLISEELKEI